jgi:hypothetical protein
MKFFLFYEDILSEARMMSDEKFDWIVNNLGDWLFEELYSRPQFVNSLPNIEQFKTFVKYKTTEKADSESDLVAALDRLGDFLNMLSPKESQNFIKSVSATFPQIGAKILRYGKPESTGKRGRPAGSKNKFKDKETKIDSNIAPEPKRPEIQQPSEPKKRGRKPLQSPLSSIERHIYKKEGPEKIQNLETKVKELDLQVDQTIQRIQKIMKDIEKRKNYFGIQ